MNVLPRAWSCISCRAKNDGDRVSCEYCGVARPEPKSTRKAPEIHQCELDGGPLDARGYCAIGQGFVITAACPFACPFCRHALTWEGKCFACFGCSTGRREDWTIPGDRYEVVGGHWRVAERPGPVSIATDSQEAAQLVIAVLDGKLTPDQGHEMLALHGISDTRR